MAYGICKDCGKDVEIHDGQCYDCYCKEVKAFFDKVKASPKVSLTPEDIKNLEKQGIQVRPK